MSHAEPHLASLGLAAKYPPLDACLRELARAHDEDPALFRELDAGLVSPGADSAEGTRLLVTGSPTSLARWASRVHERGDFKVVFLPLARALGTAREQDAVPLLARLAGLEEPRRLRDARAKLRDEVRLTADAKVLFVLDGIDDAIDEDEPWLAPLFGEVGSGVYVVASGGEGARARLGWSEAKVHVVHAGSAHETALLREGHGLVHDVLAHAMGPMDLVTLAALAGVRPRAVLAAWPELEAHLGRDDEHEGYRFLRERDAAAWRRRRGSDLAAAVAVQVRAFVSGRAPDVGRYVVRFGGTHLASSDDYAPCTTDAWRDAHRASPDGALTWSADLERAQAAAKRAICNGTQATREGGVDALVHARLLEATLGTLYPEDCVAARGACIAALSAIAQSLTAGGARVRRRALEAYERAPGQDPGALLALARIAPRRLRGSIALAAIDAARTERMSGAECTDDALACALLDAVAWVPERAGLDVLRSAVEAIAAIPAFDAQPIAANVTRSVSRLPAKWARALVGMAKGLPDARRLALSSASATDAGEACAAALLRAAMALERTSDLELRGVAMMEDVLAPAAENVGQRTALTLASELRLSSEPTTPEVLVTRVLAIRLATLGEEQEALALVGALSRGARTEGDAGSSAMATWMALLDRWPSAHAHAPPAIAEALRAAGEGPFFVTSSLVGRFPKGALALIGAGGARARASEGDAFDVARGLTALARHAPKRAARDLLGLAVARQREERHEDAWGVLAGAGASMRLEDAAWLLGAGLSAKTRHATTANALCADDGIVAFVPVIARVGGEDALLDVAERIAALVP